MARMEPTDESDGFVNITPDPGAPVEHSNEEHPPQSEELNGSSTSPRRPATRSQTTTSIMPNGSRREPSDDPDPAQSSSSKHTLDESAGEKQEENFVEPTPVDFDMSAQSYIPPPERPGPSQYTFLETYTSASQSERRGPRTRTAPPVPIPNLTKKSRGRRVPTKTAAAEKEPAPKEPSPKEGVQKGGRVYVCKVEDCGKCFSRGEHLKRHIRSIHTHEKPFKCAHPSCDKFFNRHDNLLQHQKVHKDYASPENSNDTYGPLHRIQQGPHFGGPTNLNSPPSENIIVPQPYAIFPSYHHSPLSGSIGYGTNMAVSSLRTELSPSQVEPQPLPPTHNDNSPQSHYPHANYDPALMNQPPLPHPSQPPPQAQNGQAMGEVPTPDFLGFR